MAVRPAGVVFVNNDLTDNVKAYLIKQLFITEVIDGYVFDDRLAANSNYVADLKLQNQRLMVVRPFTEEDNRTAADVVIFVSHGLASILQNNFGPPGLTHPVLRLTWNQLCIY